MSTTDQDQWLQGLQSFLNVLLQPIIKDHRDRIRYLDANAMVIWARAFTHETVSPSDNYEDLEFLGDAMLKAVFPKYLMKRLPHLHKGEYTELNVAYMSKIMQSQLARRMGLNPFIRVTGIERAILNLETDVFESFFGALDTISDSITPGLGFANCYNMILHLFSTEEIDEKKGRGSAKTLVIQTFVRFDLDKPEEVQAGDYQVEFGVILEPKFQTILRNYQVNITNPVIGSGRAETMIEAERQAYNNALTTLSNHGLLKFDVNERISSTHNYDQVQFSVVLKREHLDFLKTYDVNISDPVIGWATAATKKEAEFLAYTKALDTLERYGVTPEWAEEAKQVRDFSDPSVLPYVSKANERLRREGYVSMYFFIPRKTVTKKGAIVELVGVRPNGQHFMLEHTYTSDRENSYRNAKSLVVQQYASGPRKMLQ